MKMAGNLPKGTGIGIMILGAGVIVLPWFLDTIEPLVIPTVIGILLCLFGWWIYNIMRERGEADAEKHPDNQPEHNSLGHG